MKNVKLDSEATLVFGINPMRKSKERLARKVRVDMKREKFYTLRRINFGDRVKVVNTNPLGLGYSLWTH